MELDYKQIGQNIRKYRRRKGLKQRELAELINVSPQHISHIESGAGKLSLPVLVSITDVLEVDPNTLLLDTVTGAKSAVMERQLADMIQRARQSEKALGLIVELSQSVLQAFDL